MALFFPDAHREIDWSREPVMLETELQQIAPESEQGGRVVDKLAKVWRVDGGEEWVLVHVEVQSQPEAEFGRRMFVYNYRLFDRYNRKVASFAILGDDRAAWRPDRFSYQLWGTEVGFRFAMAKLLDYAADEPKLANDPNPFAIVVLAHLKTLQTVRDDEARRRSLVGLVKGLYERGLSAEQIRQLYGLIEAMMELPKPLADWAWREIRDFAKEKCMPYVTAAERYGLQKGSRAGLLAGIEVAVDLKFGQAGLALLPEIRQIEEVELLRKILDSIKSASSADDLCRLWRHS